MAESQAVANLALKKLEEQLTCAICLDAFKHPKLLQCFHVFCKDCLQRLVLQDQQGQLSLRCPTCRKSTVLPPATDLSSLQSAFYIHHLFDIQQALRKVINPKATQCEKCIKTPQKAINYCRDCGQFICEMCTNTHTEWQDTATHKVVSIELLQNDVKQFVPQKNVTLHCSMHKGKELELYCESCEELICLHCAINMHQRPEHEYNLLSEVFEKHKTDIIASLESVDELRTSVNNAMEQLDVRSQELNNQQAKIEANIEKQGRVFHELIEVRKAELISQVDQHIKRKLKNLATQKDEMGTVFTQLDSCVSFVRESLRTGCQGEVMKMKKMVTKQNKEMIDNFNPDMLLPCEEANIKFQSSPELSRACQQVREVYLEKLSPVNCHAVGKGLKVAKAGEKATADVNIVDNKGSAYSKPVETLISELVSESSGKKMDCILEKTGEVSRYKISYKPTRRGRYHLHIKVEGEHIKGSPFPLTVNLPVQKLGIPVKIISDLQMPTYVAVNNRGKIIVTEDSNHISFYSQTGEKLRSFGSQGSSTGQFNLPWGVAVDDDDNIVVADHNNDRVQKFTSDGKFIKAVEKKEFRHPRGIAIHPYTKHIYVVDNNNHHVFVLDSDLTFISSFGREGRDHGQFSYPQDVAFDSAGNIYVADGGNHSIQVLTADGQFLRKFGKKGKGNGELNRPTGICIDSDNVVYVTEHNNHRVSVFSCEGKHLKSFGTQGSGRGQFHYPYGITVDSTGLVYVSDSGNNRLQLF